MIGARWWIGLLAGGLCSGLAAGSDAVTGVATPGARIRGETDTAIGLFIAPWREESASDTDRPPRLFDVPHEAIDGAAFREAATIRRELRAMRRARLRAPRDGR